jgi:hypothetical protein
MKKRLYAVFCVFIFMLLVLTAPPLSHLLIFILQKAYKIIVIPARYNSTQKFLTVENVYCAFQLSYVTYLVII